MAVASCKNMRISPQKARLVVDLIRGKSVSKGMEILRFSPKKAALLLQDVLKSAIANTEHNEGADIDRLYISQISVDQGLTMKRLETAARGRSKRILKRTSNITIRLQEK